MFPCIFGMRLCLVCTQSIPSQGSSAPSTSVERANAEAETGRRVAESVVDAFYHRYDSFAKWRAVRSRVSSVPATVWENVARCVLSSLSVLLQMDHKSPQVGPIEKRLQLLRILSRAGAIAFASLVRISSLLVGFFRLSLTCSLHLFRGCRKPVTFAFNLLSRL
jgi:hypothetical protein